MSAENDEPDNRDPIALHGVTREINGLAADLAAELAEVKRLRGLLCLAESMLCYSDVMSCADSPSTTPLLHMLAILASIARERLPGGRRADQCPVNEKYLEMMGTMELIAARDGSLIEQFGPGSTGT